MMNTAVVGSTPVIVASSMPEHPVTAHKRSMRGIGITGILIGVYAIGFGCYSLHAMGDFGASYYDYSYGYSVYSYGWMMVGAGIWFVISGSLAVAVSASPTNCNVVGGIVIAILASMAAFGLLIREAAVVFPLFSGCSYGEGSTCESFAGLIFAHTLLLVLALAEFVMVIVQASYSCRCCGRSYAPTTTMHIPGAMTVTTTAYGKGYAPLHNEQDGGYPAAYQPPPNSAAPPSYY